MDSNYMYCILDEVALEGLDGITLSTLWQRLENRPNFPIKIDDNSKAFLWNSFALHKDIEIFKLPKPRKFVPFYNRYNHVDELGLVLEPPEPLTDVYPVEMINDGDIRGSCATYHTRENITSLVRDNGLMSFSEVTTKWGDKLVLVASPRARLRSLIGDEGNPNTFLSSEEYCLLERIGRSRYHGEVSQGEIGLLKMKAPFSKQLHYYRKKLTQKGFVTKQRHFSRTNRGVAVCGSLFHLVRFYMLKKSKMEILLQCMVDILKTKPKNMETCQKIREKLNITSSTFKKLFHRNVEKYLRIVTVPAKEFNPAAATSIDSVKFVKAVKLIKKCSEEDNLEDDDKDESQSSNIYFDLNKIYLGVPLIVQLYRLIQKSGPSGLSLIELRIMMTLPRLHIREMVNVLLRKKFLVTILQEKGRQKETKYIATNLGDQNEAYAKVQQEEANIEDRHIDLNVKRKNEAKDGSKNKRNKLNNEGTYAMLQLSDKERKCQHENQKENSESENLDSIAFQSIEVEINELQDFKEFTGKPPHLLHINESSRNTVSLNYPNKLTYRKFKRISFILEYVKICKFTNLSDLQKLLRQKEKEEGYNFQVDRRSTLRLLHWLFVQKKLKLIKAVLKLDTQKTEIDFICDNSLKPDDPSFHPVIEQSKFKFYTSIKDGNSNPNGSSVGDEDDDDDDDANESNKKSEQKVYSTHDLKIIQDLQTHPKFVRCKTLHKFLYYLVYGYEGHLKDDTHDPTIYHDSMTWKRFIPPLPSDRKEGWCFLADIYNRLPLSIFVKSVNMRQRINDVAEYLVDDEKSNYLIKYLPKKMLKILLDRRKYLFHVDEVIKNLCYMGLLSYGPQVAKHKDHTFVYVHKMGAFKNTSISTPGYLHINSNIFYEKKVFTFNSLADVEKYWMELEQVCSSTPLGKYSAVVGETFIIVESRHKLELCEALKHKNFDEISDCGCIPGDGLGAGGLDSTLFAHSRRNWQSIGSKENEKVIKTVTNPTTDISIQALLKQNKILNPENSRLQRLSRIRLAAQKDKNFKKNFSKNSESAQLKKIGTENSNPSKPSKSKKRVKVRTIKARHKKARAPYLDEKDKAAIERMALTRSRAEWSAQEDSFLLLCKVASCFLDPSWKGITVPFTIIRDLLQEHLPVEGSNKTSRACQRRIRYMMFNPTTVNNVAVFLGEAKQDRQLVDFKKSKPPKTNEEAWSKFFTAVLKGLLAKFSLPASDRCKNYTLPKTRELFEKLFVILRSRTDFEQRICYKDPENENDVKSDVLYSLIVSTMVLENDGTVWSYLLYKLYHVYPEYVLRSVVSRLRSEKVIACRKRKSKRDFEPSLMATFPYRLSITYENNLLTKFPIKLFSHCKEFLDKIRVTDNGVITLHDNISPGYTVAIMALTALNEINLTLKIPEHIILFDSSLSKEARSSIVERMMHTLTDKESHELVKILNSGKEQTKNVSTDKDSRVSEEVITLLNQSANEVQRSTNASRFALYLLRQELSQPPIERVQHSQDFIILNSCEINCHLRNNEEMAYSNNQEAHFQTNKQEPRGKILTDGCISEIKASLTAFIPPGAFNQYQNFDEPLEMIYDAYSSQTLNNAKCIFGEIFSAGFKGISEETLWKKFGALGGELSLFEHLHLFREAMLVIRAGVATFLYVCISFAKVWALHSYSLPEIYCNKTLQKRPHDKTSEDATDFNSQLSSKNLSSQESMEYSEATESCSEKPVRELDSVPQFSVTNLPAVIFTEDVYFLPRTWRRPDGSLNKKTLIQLLQTVLSYIIHSPAVSTSNVVERFQLILQPVQTLELLEILEKGCCITKYFCKKPKKGSLFSSINQVVITKNPEPDDFDHLEPVPDAVCNLIKIQDAI